MIAHLAGKLLRKHPEAVVIDVHGVGYQVTVSAQSFFKLPAEGEPVALRIHTHVREDAIALYGFLDETEQRLFERLIGVNGVGPRLALNILSGAPAAELIQALQREDLVRLTAVPGIGRKTAQRLILDLKDKLVELLVPEGAASGEPARPRRLYDDVLSALVNLGYKRATAEKALTQLNFGDGLTLAIALKEALKALAEVR